MFFWAQTRTDDVERKRHTEHPFTKTVNPLCTSENRITKASERGTSPSTPPPMPAPRCGATLVASIWLWLWRGVAKTTPFHGTTFSQLRVQRRPHGPWRGPCGSGHVRSFARLARARATPSLLAAPGLANHHNGGYTKVVSTASRAPPNNGKPSATISRRPSRGLGTAQSMSLTIWLVVTRAPLAQHPCPGTRFPGGGQRNPVDGHNGTDMNREGDANDVKKAPERVKNRAASRNL